MKNIKRNILLVVIIFLSTNGFSQKKKTKLAVLDFVVAGIDSTYKNVLIEQTRIAFINTGKYKVIETSEIDKVNHLVKDSTTKENHLYDKNGNFNIKAITSIKSITEVGVIGSIAKFGDMYSIAIKGITSSNNRTSFAKSGIAKSFPEIPFVLQSLISDEKNGYNIKRIAQIDFNGPLYIYPTDNAQSVNWSPKDMYTTKTEATSILNGKKNTEKIVEIYGDGEYAANICNQLNAYGYDDWYLPSKEELNAMFNSEDEIDNFPADNMAYWYSTEDTDKTDKYKLDERACRCVRRDEQN